MGRWQTFTEMARKTVFYAQEEARRFGCRNVGPDHISLGFLREADAVAVVVLTNLGAQPQPLRARIEADLSRPNGDQGPFQLTLSPAGNQVIDLAIEESIALSDNFVGTEHLLLGILREGNSFTSEVLFELGVTVERARECVRTLRRN
jgi:ATP-dependent Clp protease ATP-binding subunit ClpC